MRGSVLQSIPHESVESQVRPKPNSTAPATIRDTGIHVLRVFTDLEFHGLTEAQILERYPALTSADLLFVREEIARKILSRTHDEMMGRALLRRSQLVHGRYYVGRCRHATIARWNAEQRCFYHWREKLGRIYVETILYPTDEMHPWWDAFIVRELPNAKVEIPFDHEAVFEGNVDDLVEFVQEMREGIVPSPAR